ncbi:hypothetical protein [Pukyongiella litopenaei]|uniref:Uncharacterized protein n=1 Tax=Pukyongiella litopenaei TaxID=2605946 RepID=A0A2S0MTN9_9RHOB|nr:hypothetical protein [Pukyongiella litopenaei]AVO39232.1 hypothetical protein C6Y53_16960 [Pukyongiella litopenaei]
MRRYLGLSYVGSTSALGVAFCCVLPMVMTLLGMGGSWLAVFGKVAGVSYHVLAVSTVLVVAPWLVAHRRGALARLRWWLAGSTAMTVLAWVMVLTESRINDYLIRQM